MDASRTALLQKCKQKLLKMREDRLNGLKSLATDLVEPITGDEADLAKGYELQHSNLIQREKFLTELKEIDNALSRIENNMFGVCEETGEPIEADRLMAIPWARLSIEGAEMREKIRKKFA